MSVGSKFFAPSDQGIRVFISYERGDRMQTFRRVAMAVKGSEKNIPSEYEKNMNRFTLFRTFRADTQKVN
jgi:hypothetical protein